ncbi:MAG: flagellar basal body P-ring formation protein FlgA [Gemmatimonadaceae bacterium]|nr:flagellar basal body P-ring formation protein FlgA [Gemmatimonadaceae bacterium]
MTRRFTHALLLPGMLLGGAPALLAQSPPATVPAAGPPAAAMPAASPSTPQAARDIARGTVLGRADVAGDSAAADSLAGWVARRRIRMGEALRSPAIGHRALVSPGMEVTVLSSHEGVSVKWTGTALSGGALGERIRVRMEGARIVVASVTGPAEAAVP